MEEFSGNRFDCVKNAVRKKRSQTSRPRRPDSQSFTASQDHSPLSSTPPSDDLSKFSSDENASADANSGRTDFNLNQYVSRISPAVGVEVEKTHKSKKEDGGFNAFYNNEPVGIGSNSMRSSEGVLAPANRKCTIKVKEWSEFESRNEDIYGGRNGEIWSSALAAVIDGNESKVKKVKLKVGGVTRTIHANSNGLPGSGSSIMKNSLQGSTDHGHSSPDKRSVLRGVPWKDFSKGGFSFGKEDSLMGKTSGKNISGKQGDQAGVVHKSKRVPKRRVLDGEFGEDDEDDEIRYLEKLRTSKISPAYKEDDDESGKKQKKLSRVSNIENFGTSTSTKDKKRKHRSDRVSEDTYYEEEDEPISDIEIEGKKKKKQRKSVDVLMESKKEVTLTTRQRALQSSKDASSAPGSSLIEFPNGLPPAQSRKQKEKLSEVEQQLKKAEAAQRRRMQVEKANRESEAEAIRKILGQDSSRKKKEDKIKKRREELAQEKAVNALMLASNTIRLVMGPTGTTVTFPRDMGFPSIFDSRASSYPPPRENCAAPSCANPYKYRDSKSKLPLCSLLCYKAIREQLLAETTC